MSNLMKSQEIIEKKLVELAETLAMTNNKKKRKLLLNKREKLVQQYQNNGYKILMGF